MGWVLFATDVVGGRAGCAAGMNWMGWTGSGSSCGG